MQNNYPLPMRRNYAGPLAHPAEVTFTDIPFNEESDLLRHYCSVIYRHLWMILGILAVAEVVTLIFLARAPRLYTSSSTISIEAQAPDVMARDNRNNDDNTVDPSFYATEWEVLRSRTIAARVIRDLRLAEDPAFMGTPESPSLMARISSWLKAQPVLHSVLALPGALFASRPAPPPAHSSGEDIMGVKSGLIDDYLSGLSIRPEFDTRMVVVSYTSTDPVLSARLANAHVQAYIQQGYDLRTRSSQTAQRFLESQLGELEQRLEKSEAALNGYRQDRGIVAFTLDDKDRLVSERIADINKDMVDAQERRIALEAEVETIKSNDYDAVPEVVNNSLIQGLKAELSKLQGQYANLSTEYTDSYPDVLRLRAQIRQVQQHERNEIARVVASIKSQYNTAQDRENQLSRQLEREKTRAMALNNASLRDAVLAREVETNRALYRDVLERFKMLGVASEARLTNVSIVDAATVSQYPSSPKKRLSIVIAGFLALMSGITLAFLIEMHDKGLKSADELEQFLRLPALATVLRFSDRPERKAITEWLPVRLLGNSMARPDSDLIQLEDGSDLSAGSRAAESSFSASLEAYRTIRTRILLSRPESPPKTILFTSAVSGEGKTAVALNTAVAFASLQERVVLVDGDLRRGRCHEIMNRSSGPGLSEVLSGLCTIEQAIQPTAVKGLFVVCAGANAPNPSELIGSRKMAEVLAQLGASFRFVVVDSAPVLPVSDSVLLSTMVDAVVVVAGRATPRHIVRLGCARLTSIGARIIGAVLNGAELEHEPYYTHYMRT